MNETRGLSKAAISRARRTVAQAHPTFKRVAPSVKPKTGGEYLLTFRLSVALPGGATLRQVLRATVNETGEVLRVVTSRG